MGNEISSYHFLNIDQFQIAESISYIKKLYEFETIVCFDLEDSIPGEYEGKHKNNIVTAIKFLRKEIPEINLGIRINTPESKSFNSDLEFLNFFIFNKYFNIEIIVILNISKLNIILINSELL